jgi:transcriptional regulator with XRE-family HTH domain
MSSPINMDWRQIFAANLRRLRHAQGLSQEALALEAEMNRTYISKLEAGKTWAGLEIMVKLAEVFGVEPADLLKHRDKRRNRRS